MKRGGWIIIAALVALTCPTSATADDDPFVAVTADVRRSVVAIGVYNRNDVPSIQYLGTGFVVSTRAGESGHVIATNAHVIASIRDSDRLGDLRVFFPDTRDVEGRVARLLAEDRFHDVALLRFEGPPAPAIELDLQQAPRQGMSVGIVGYPIGTRLGLVPAVHRGVVAAVVPSVLPLPRGVKLTPELAEAIRRPYNLFQLDMVVFPGNSGSPLYDARTGKAIGIINKALATRTREHMLERPSGIAYAVPVRWIFELMVRSGVIQPHQD